MKRILVSGSLSYDRIMDFPGLFKDHFLPDALHNLNVSFAVGAPKTELGGCAGNVAYSLSLLETPSDILGCAGADFAPYEAQLKDCGVGTDTIDHYDDVPTSSAYITTDKADNQITAFSEGAGGKTYRKDVKNDYALILIGPGAVENMVLSARKAKEYDIPYFFDPGQQLPALSKDMLLECITGATAVFVNDYERALLLEKTGLSEEALVAQLEFLVVTYGAEGSRIVSKEGEVRVQAVPVTDIVDPTGAGDAYRAGFIASYTRGSAPEEAAKLASVVAAYAVECYGTQNHRFTNDELRARFEAAYQSSFPV